MKNNKGFTLMELMVVVLIIAALAAIAYPTYSKVIIRARIAEAISLGEIVREAEQRSLALNGSYFNQFRDSHASGDTRLIKSISGVSVRNGNLIKDDYTVTLLKKGTCIQIEYEKGEKSIFKVYMHVEDSRIGCTQPEGITGVCQMIPSAETGSLDCIGE